MFLSEVSHSTDLIRTSRPPVKQPLSLIGEFLRLYRDPFRKADGCLKEGCTVEVGY